MKFISTPAPADKSRRLRRSVLAEPRRRVEGVPEDAFMASGHMGQYTMVIPSRDMVVVRLGRAERLTSVFQRAGVSATERAPERSNRAW